MRQQGLKPAEVARKAGLAPSYVSEILSGTKGKRPSGRVISALARALGVKGERLLDSRRYQHAVHEGE